MSEPAIPGPTHPFEAILRRCAAADPEPWSPRGHAPSLGLSREDLDEYLEDLCLDGLLQRAEGTPESNPGLTLTPPGRGVLNDPAALRRLNEGRAVFPAVRGCVVREAIRRPRRPVVTWLLIGVNLAAFAYTLVLASSNTTLLWDFLRISPFGGADRPGVAALVERAGGVYGADWVHGAWSRLATSCFVHVGVFHLLINMVALYRVGAEVEQMWGRVRYVIIYAFAGLGGSCLGVAMRPQAASAGASGALCGVVAAAAVWWLCNGRCLPRALVRELRVNLLINGVLITLISLVPGVSGWGHLGGALAGAAAALALQVQRFARPPWRWAAPMALLALPWLGYAVIERRRVTDPEWAPFNAAPADGGRHRLPPKVPR